MWIECENLKATVLITDYGRSKTNGECGIFEDLGSFITSNTRNSSDIKSKTVVAKAAINKPKGTSPAN
jgi:hypothetical protein